MDRLAGMEAFVAVVESGSFSAAGRRLGLTRAVVGKRVAALEEGLGVQLLNRTTRQVGVTGPGAEFFERSRRIVNEFQEASLVLANQQLAPEGPIRLNAPMSFGQQVLAPLLLEFMRQCPRVLVQLNLTDRFVDVVAEGYDLVLRIAEPEDSSLIRRRLAAVPRLLCAAPAYLDQAGAPQRVAELAQHRLLHYGHQRTGLRWQLQGPQGQESVEQLPVFCANNGEVLAQAALAGQGIVLLPTFIVQPYLADGRLCRVLPAWQGSTLELHALWPGRRPLPQRVRLLIDFLVARLGE